MKLGFTEEAEDCGAFVPKGAQRERGRGRGLRWAHGGSGVLRALDGAGEVVFSLRSSTGRTT